MGGGGGSISDSEAVTGNRKGFKGPVKESSPAQSQRLSAAAMSIAHKGLKGNRSNFPSCRRASTEHPQFNSPVQG
jgi:hypothetical protein